MRNELIAAVALAALVVTGTAWADKARHAEAEPQVAAAGAKQMTVAPTEEKNRNYFTDLPLVNQHGEQVRFYSDVLKGRVVVINFIFTNCGDACPLLVFKLTQVRDSLGGYFGDPVHFVSISVDPERDTPDELRKFARQQRAEDDAWIYLTGTKRNVDTVVKRLGQYSSEVEAHSTLMIAGNVDSGKWSKIPPQTPPSAIALKVRNLFAPIGR